MAVGTQTSRRLITPRSVRARRPKRDRRISPEPSVAAPADDVRSLARAAEVDNPALTAARPGHAELSEGWIVVTGALVAVFAIREGLRRISQQPVVLHAKAPYMLDVVAALFVAKEGLHRLGSWALRAPANTARS